MTEYHNLMKMKRSELDTMADELGIADVNQYDNKHAIAKAIITLEEAIPEVAPSVEVEAVAEAPIVDHDDGLIEVVVIGSHFGYNKEIYSKGQTLRVPPEVEAKNRLICVPVAPESQNEVNRLKSQIIEMNRTK